MDCKIMKKEAFTVLCRAKTFKYEDAVAQVPQFWAEHFAAGGGKVVCGMYGINVELYSDASKFEGGTQDQDYYCEIWIPVEKK